MDTLAERSKAVAQGAIPKGRGFEPHRCHFVGVTAVFNIASYDEFVVCPGNERTLFDQCMSCTRVAPQHSAGASPAKASRDHIAICEIAMPKNAMLGQTCEGKGQVVCSSLCCGFADAVALSISLPCPGNWKMNLRPQPTNCICPSPPPRNTPDAMLTLST